MLQASPFAFASSPCRVAPLLRRGVSDHQLLIGLPRIELVSDRSWGGLGRCEEKILPYPYRQLLALLRPRGSPAHA